MLENETRDNMSMMSGISGNRNGAETPMNSRCVDRSECERLISDGCQDDQHQHRCNFVSSHLPLDSAECNCATDHTKPTDTLVNCCYCDECGDGGCCCQQCCTIHAELTSSTFDSDETGADEQNIRDGDCCLRPNRLLDNYYSGTLQRFAIYENLCQRCGYGVGCGCANFDEALFNESYEDEDETDNIYENVCDTCSYIYSGDRCELCQQREPIAKKSPSTGKQLNKFAELLGNLRQRLKEKTQKSPPVTLKPRPQIVHNIGDVFKTNQTFDLNEIVRLKQQQAPPVEKPVYGKLRNSDEYLSLSSVRRRSDQYHRTIQASASDSNFLTNTQLSLTPFVDATAGIYENLPIQSVPFPYEQHTEFLPALPQPQFNDIHIHSLRNWMTSLRGQTYDYGDDTKYAACSVKCIPSMYVSCCAHFMRATTMHDNPGSGVDKCADDGAQRSQDMEVWTRVDQFRANLIENRSKRNAIYIKPKQNESEVEPLIYAGANAENHSQLSEARRQLLLLHGKCDAAAGHTEPSESEITNRIHEMTSAVDVDVDAKKSSPSTVVVVKVPAHKHVPSHSSPRHTETQFVQWNDEIARAIKCRPSLAIAFQSETLRRDIVTQLALSTSLNRTTLVYDKRLHAFLMNALGNEPNRNTQKYRRDLNDMLIIFHKTHGVKPLAAPRKQLAVQVAERANKVDLNDFALHPRSTTGPAAPKRLDDFEMNHSESMMARNKTVIEDFQRPIKEPPLPKKTLNDFELRRPTAVHERDGHYSSTTANEYKEDHEIKIRNSETVSGGGGGATMTAMVNDSAMDENIYQSIWKFQTVGSARESDVSFVSEYYTASEYCEEVVDVAEWEVAEEFAFATQRNSQLIDLHDATSCEDNRSVRSGSTVDPYRTVCILYNVDTTKYNKIIYDYNGNNVYGADLEAEKKPTNVLEPSGNGVTVAMEKPPKDLANGHPTNQTSSTEIVDSVFAWKQLIRSAAYMEDEEDLMLPESFLIEHLIQANNEENSKYKLKTSNDSSPMVSSNESLSEEPICKFSERRFGEKTDNRILNPSPPPETKAKREIGFLNKLQYRRFDVSKNNKKEDGVQGLFYKNLDSKAVIVAQHTPIETRKITSNLVFGVDLDEVEKDEKHTNIPKFVVECIKIIELDENIQTNGIYRASGKKESIDKLKKKMNESKLRKGTKYVALKDEDVHTVTGALKQFFRELKTDLIPIEIVKRLPDDLERAENLVRIKKEMDTIDFLPRESLKYLLKHLIFVDKNSEHNLMNASNLSIVWGACIFTSSVTAADTIETSDLMKKNTLFKILIQRFHDIFPNV